MGAGYGGGLAAFDEAIGEALAGQTSAEESGYETVAGAGRVDYRDGLYSGLGIFAGALCDAAESSARNDRSTGSARQQMVGHGDGLLQATPR